jgi:hypothetical protein
VDRQRASANIRTGLFYASIAIFVFGLAFFVAILYLP